MRQNHTYTKHFNTMTTVATPTLVILDGDADYIPWIELIKKAAEKHQLWADINPSVPTDIVQHSNTVLVCKRHTCLFSPGKDFLILIKCYINSKNELTTSSIRTILLSNPNLLQKRQLLTLDSKVLHSIVLSSQQTPSLSQGSRWYSAPQERERAEPFEVVMPAIVS